MSGNFQEYVAYLDTHNAEPQAEPNDNPTNDVIIPCQFPQRLNVAQISLGSLELPLAQYNIESDWNTLQFDEGIDLYVMTPDDEPMVQFVINENGVDYVGQLPPRLNPIIDIQPPPGTVNPAEVIFTTQYPHQLALRGFFNWGEAMKVINTPIPDPYCQLTATNAHLTIVSETQFRLTLPGLPLTFGPSTSSILGYVSTPSLPSPAYLADLVTQALDLVLPHHWKVTYDKITGKYKLCWVGNGCEAQQASPAFLVYLGTNSLGHIMGFACTDTPLPLPGSEPTTTLVAFDKPREVPSLSTNCVQSVNCSPCRSQIEIDVGNYNPDGLMANVSRQLNRFYFDPGVNNGSTLSSMAGGAPPPTFYYSNQTGLCYSFQIPFGLYSPDSLATYLQSQMTAHVPSIAVTWDVNDGRFTFAAQEDFGLEFNISPSPEPVVSTPELAYRLGFYPLSYRNNNTYKSVMPFYFPTKGCCGTSIPDRHLSYVYTPMPQALLNNQKRFAVELSKPRSILTVGPVTDNGDGTLSITTRVYLSGIGATLDLAHGFQVLDTVEITIGNTTYEVMVSRVDAFNKFTVDWGLLTPTQIPNLTGAPPFTPYCVRLSNTIVSNLYFSCLDNDILALTLGFNRSDYLWSPVTPTSWIAPALYCLDYPNYVLVELTQPTGATHNMHPWNTDPDHTDTLSNVLAKVILYPQFRMERSFPFHMIIPDLRVINRVKIRILNPNHSPYRLHSRHFSFTLVFQAVNKSINQLCY